MKEYSLLSQTDLWKEYSIEPRVACGKNTQLN